MTMSKARLCEPCWNEERRSDTVVVVVVVVVIVVVVVVVVVFQVFSGLTALRKLCNHPDLVTNDYSECRKQREEGNEEEEAARSGCGIITVPKSRKRQRKNGTFHHTLI